MRRVERPKPAQVEDRPEVDEERVVPRAGEDLPAAAEVGDTLDVVVRRVRPRPDVRRRDRQVRAEHRSSRTLVTARDRVRLLDVQVRVGGRGDLAGVVEERVRVRDVRLEPELVRDVVTRVPVVVDVDLVEDSRVEAVVVRPARRILERDVVRDDRDGVRLVRAHERVDVRVVGGRIVRDQRCLAVAGRRRARRADRADERRGRDCAATSPASASSSTPLFMPFSFPRGGGRGLFGGGGRPVRLRSRRRSGERGEVMDREQYVVWITTTTDQAGHVRGVPPRMAAEGVPRGDAPRVRVLLGGLATRSSGSRSGTRTSRGSGTRVECRGRPPRGDGAVRGGRELGPLQRPRAEDPEGVAHSSSLARDELRRRHAAFALPCVSFMTWPTK